MHRRIAALAPLGFALALALFAAPETARAQSAMPAPSPTPTPSYVKHEAFVVGDYLISPRVYNAFDPGAKGSGQASYDARFASEFSFMGFPVLAGVDQHDFQYIHPASGTGTCPGLGCIDSIGHGAPFYQHASVQRDTDTTGIVGYRIAYPKIYAVFAYLARQSSYNYPVLNGVGLGFLKLPERGKTASIYFNGYYFPDLEGKFDVFNRTTGAVTRYTLTEHDIQYQAGVAIEPLKSTPAFIDLGILGDGIRAGAADPDNATHFTEYAGIGLYSQ